MRKYSYGNIIKVFYILGSSHPIGDDGTIPIKNRPLERAKVGEWSVATTSTGEPYHTPTLCVTGFHGCRNFADACKFQRPVIGCTLMYAELAGTIHEESFPDDQDYRTPKLAGAFRRVLFARKVRTEDEGDYLFLNRRNNDLILDWLRFGIQDNNDIRKKYKRDAFGRFAK